MVTPLKKATMIKEVATDDGKQAVVVEEHTKTMTYKQDSPNEREDTKNKNESANQGNANSGQSNANLFEAKTALPENKLASLFEELKEYEEFEGETFYALITRRADLMHDNFKKPCLSPQAFPVMQVNSGMMFQFIPQLQKYNGNSGGRFDIVMCADNGESLGDGDVGLNGYVVSDPVEEIKNAESRTQNEGINVIELFEKMNQASEKRFEQMLNAMRPQEDEFTKLVKEKMRNDFLHPPQRDNNEFDTKQMIANIMGNVAVMQAMGEGFAQMFNKNSGGEKDKGLLESLLSNEVFLDKAQDVGSRLIDSATDIAIAYRNPQAYQQRHTERYEEEGEEDTGYPPLPPQQQQPQQEKTQQEMDREQVIKDILAELEGDKPLDDTNEFLKVLKEENKDLFILLLMSCKMTTFEKLIEQLSQIVPDVFAQYGSGTELNEKGQYISGRLKQFYEYMKVQEI